MALTRPQFHAIESVQEFDDLLRGAVVTRLWQEDQWGYLRRDLLIAQGVKYSDQASGLAQKDDAPTFERVMGRAPLAYTDPFGLHAALAYLQASQPDAPPLVTWAGQPPPSQQSELAQEEAADRIARARELLAEAAIKAGQAPPSPPA